MLLLTAALLTTVYADSTLKYVATYWRHGARAPSDRFSDPANAQHFPNGVGQLTHEGMENEYKLGKYLGDRYVNGELLDVHMDNSQFYTRSIDLTRCLESGVAVMQGMFSKHASNMTFPLPVAVHSNNMANDYILNTPWDTCERKVRLYHRHCPDFPPVQSFGGKFHSFELAVFQCLKKRNEKFAQFSDDQFNQIEALITETLSGNVNLVRPDWYNGEAEKDANDVYYTVSRFVSALGEFRDETVLQVTIGEGLNIILNDMEKTIGTCFDSNNNNANCAPLKFRAFSTQDWILMSILEAFDMREFAMQGQSVLNAQFSSAIIFELWDIDGQPTVKMLFKRNATEGAVELPRAFCQREMDTLRANRVPLRASRDTDSCSFQQFRTKAAFFRSSDARTACCEM